MTGSNASSMLSMKLSVSIPVEDIEFLDDYAGRHSLSSRSAAMQRAVRALRMTELGDQYEAAWDEWAASEDAALWDTTVGDGIE